MLNNCHDLFTLQLLVCSIEADPKSLTALFHVSTLSILQSDDEAEAEELLHSDLHPNAS